MWSAGPRGWLTYRLSPGFEHIVPIVRGGPKALDGGVDRDHFGGHVVAGGIGVKAAINRP